MPKFIITHGSVITARPLEADGSPKKGGKQTVLSVGDEIELSPEDRKHIDPTGTQFVTPEMFADLKKAADAHLALEQAARRESDNPKAKAPAISAKTLKAIAALKPNKAGGK